MDGKSGRVGRVILLLACLALVMALAACGGGGGEGGGEGTATPGGSATPSGDTATPSGDTVEITMWHSEVASNLDTLQTLVRSYNSLQSEVKVKLAFQGTDDEEMTKLVASLRGGELPNIAYLGEVIAQRLIDSGAITPVQEFIDREKYDLSDLNKKPIDYYTLDGELWAMPFATLVPLLYYDKVVFRELGLDPEKPPKDLEQLRQVSEKMVKRDAHGNLTRSGVAIDITGWYLDLTLQEHGDPYVNNENGRGGRATEVLFNGPTGRAYFQWWHDMVEDGLALDVGRDPTYAQGFLAIGAGRAGMCFGGSAALRSVLDVLEGRLQGRQVEIGVANQPGVPGGTGLPGIFSRVAYGSSNRTLRLSKRRPGSSSSGSWNPSSRRSGTPAAATCPSTSRRLSCRRPRRSRPGTRSSRSPPTS